AARRAAARLAPPPPRPKRLPRPPEAVVLGTVLLASACLATTWPAPPVALEGTATSAKEGLVRELKNTVLEGDKGTGYIVSSCQVEGDRVYVAAARQQGAENY